MPRYHLPNGKTIFTEQDIAPEHLDEFISEMMGGDTAIEEQPQIHEFQPQSQVEKGNINLFKQPEVRNPSGSTSTVDSISVGEDGREVVIPQIMPDGRRLNGDAAVEEYRRTGRHLGKFDSVADAEIFAGQLHDDYAAGKYRQRPAEDILREAKAPFGMMNNTDRSNEADTFAEGVLKSIIGAPQPREAQDTVNQVREPEPDTWLGGFTKSLKDQILEATVGNEILQKAARPETTADMLNLIVPAELPNLRGMFGKRGGQLEQIAEQARNPEIAPAEVNFPKQPLINEAGIEIAPAQAESIARPAGPWDMNGHATIPVKSSEDATYELAREKFNMGKDNPALANDKLPIDNRFGSDYGEGYKPQYAMRESGHGMFDVVDENTGEILSKFTGADDAQDYIDNLRQSGKAPSPTKLPHVPHVTGEKQPELKPGTIVVIHNEPITPEFVKKIKNSGYKLVGVNDEGSFRLRKIGPTSSDPNFAGGMGDPELAGSVPYSQPTAQQFASQVSAAPPQQPPAPPMIPPTNSGIPPTPPVPPNPFDNTSMFQKVYDLPRGLMSVDPPFITSAAFRQGAPLIGTKAWFKSWGKAASSYGSEKAYIGILDGIEARPLFSPKLAPNGKKLPSTAESLGLNLSDLGKYSRREEALRGELAEMIPGYGKLVRASNRAYTGFLNTLRADTFETLINDATKLGLEPTKNEVLGRQIADFVNDATGRGRIELKMGNRSINLEDHAKLLSNTFFSPRKIASQISMLNPSTYIMADSFVRKQYLSAMIRQVGTWWTIAGLAQLAGAQVSKDSNSADFGKIRIGNTRIDVPGGLQQFLVLGSRIASNSSTSSTTGVNKEFGVGYKPATRASTLEDFGVNRLHPTAKAAWDLMSATRREPFHMGDKIAQMALPMYADDLVDVLRENPELAPLVLGLSGSGMGAQSYERGTFGKPTFVPEEYDWNIGAKR